MMPANLPPVIVCQVVKVYDSDTIACRNGIQVRLAGISALERSGRCNSAPDCPTMRHKQAGPIAARMMLGQTYRFKIYGVSGKRLVGDVPALRCALIRTGAVVTWRKWAVRNGLGGCR